MWNTRTIVRLAARYSFVGNVSFAELELSMIASKYFLQIIAITWSIVHTRFGFILSINVYQFFIFFFLLSKWIHIHANKSTYRTENAVRMSISVSGDLWIRSKVKHAHCKKHKCQFHVTINLIGGIELILCHTWWPLISCRRRQAFTTIEHRTNGRRTEREKNTKQNQTKIIICAVMRWCSLKWFRCASENDVIYKHICIYTQTLIIIAIAVVAVAVAVAVRLDVCGLPLINPPDANTYAAERTCT